MKTTISNISAVCQLGYSVNLIKMYEQIAHANGDSIDYNPEIFPGAIYKINDGDVHISFLIFRSGKVIISGSKSQEQLDAMANKIAEVCKTYEFIPEE